MASPTLLSLDLVALLPYTYILWEQQNFITVKIHPHLREETCASGLVLQSTPADQTGCPLTVALLTLQGRAEVLHGLPGQWPKQLPRSACLHFGLNLRMLYPCCAPFGFSNNFYLNTPMHHLIIL